jgi:hypothetical protein
MKHYFEAALRSRRSRNSSRSRRRKYGFFLSNFIEKRSLLLKNAKIYKSFNLNLLHLYVFFVNTTHSQAGAKSGAGGGAGAVILIYGSAEPEKIFTAPQY